MASGCVGGQREATPVVGTAGLTGTTTSHTTEPGDDDLSGSPVDSRGGGRTTGRPPSTTGGSTEGDATSEAPGTSGTGGGSTTGATTAMGGSTGDDGPPNHQGEATVEPGDLIDDMEDGNGDIPRINGRIGSWYTYNDGTGTQTPAPKSAVLPIAISRGASQKGLETTGSGSTVWGSGLGVDLNNTGASRSVWNASAFAGLTFWAKGQGSVRLQIPIPATVTAAEGGTCVPPSSSTMPGCYDTHGVVFGLRPEWTSYIVPWTALRQAGWGIPAAFDPSRLLGIQFQFDKGVSFGFGLDDIGLYKPGAEHDPSGGSSSTGGGTGTTGGTASTTGASAGTTAGTASTTGASAGTTAGSTTGGGTMACDATVYDGKTTRYDLPGAAGGNCGMPRLPGYYYAALNQYDYGAAAACGACVQITSKANGATIVAQVIDNCPDAPPNQQWCFNGSHHIDLEASGWAMLGDNAAITWSYIPCTVSGGLEYVFHQDSKGNDWLAVQIRNHAHRIAKVEVQQGSGWVALVRESWNYFTGSGLGGGPYTFRVTDIYGGTAVESGVVHAAGATRKGTVALPACQ